LVEFTPRALELIENSRQSKKGAIVAGVHLSNFDLVAQAAALRGLRAVGLSLPEPDEAVEWQHKYRRRSGIEILPASMANIRQVIERLQAGETVLTGIDRPQNGLKYHPRFFGRQAHLPVHYIHIGLKAHVPLVVMAAIWGADNVYHILSSDDIQLEHFPDHQEEIQINSERVLQIAESFILQAPLQWASFHPVWPEILNEVPE
jgi:lauroyl/myristoyl acyltransferase